jgi:hypothetical protein
MKPWISKALHSCDFQSGFAKAVAACLILVCALVSIPYLRRQAIARNWPLIVSGMSQEEVRSLLGAPDSTYERASDIVRDEAFKFILWHDNYHDRWAYGPRPVFSIKRRFPYVGPPYRPILQPMESDRVIYFSDDGFVTKTRFPYSESD